MLRFLIIICSLWFWFCFTIVKVFGQGETCTNPILVSPCPNVSYTSVSTAGMGNEVNATYYGVSMKGNDVIYKVAPQSSNTNVLISIKNVSATAILLVSNSACAVPTYIYSYLYPGSTYDNLSFAVSTASPLYVMIDHNNATDITFDISFGALGGYQYVTVPDTRGAWLQANGCLSSMTKPYMNVKWNGVQQILPMTLSPLNAQGTMCITPYLKNLTGREGVKSISFTFDPDLSNPLPTVTQMNGFYNSGTWNAVKSGNVITWRFSDAAGIGKGDFTGVPNNCLAYEFCFSFTPLSNNPLRTNINLFLQGDGNGTGYSYTTYGSGCCATTNSSCKLNYGGPGGGSSGSTMGMGINDPPLPVELISFEAVQKNNKVLLEWATAVEINNDRFEIERSLDGITYSNIGMVAALGRASLYNFTDADPLTTIGYYRLKQIDTDGQATYSNVVTLQNIAESEIHIFPVPAQNSVTISSALPISEYSIIDMYGNSIANEAINNEYSYEISVQSLSTGLYYLKVKVLDKVIVKRLVKQ